MTEQPSRKPFLVVIGVLTIFVVGVVALVLSLAISIRPHVNERPNMGRHVVVPTEQAVAPPAPKAQVPASPTPARRLRPTGSGTSARSATGRRLRLLRHRAGACPSARTSAAAPPPPPPPPQRSRHSRRSWLRRYRPADPTLGWRSRWRRLGHGHGRGHGGVGPGPGIRIPLPVHGLKLGIGF
ncbi:hypothetical protein I552_7555 [Mycobacterium xenopi 3993]|nr:hypothetical protein I552_7555 [Mycobacterium xenopi 3993]